MWLVWNVSRQHCASNWALELRRASHSAPEPTALRCFMCFTAPAAEHAVPHVLTVQGAGFYIVSLATLAGAASAALQGGEGGAQLWQGLQLLGATAGAAVVLVIPGLALCCGRRHAGG